MAHMKARLAAGETLFGTFLTLGSPLAAESLALAGFDWLLVDLEHGGGDESLLLGQLLGATAGGAHALVRVESDVRGRTARALDLGVEGVMCPQVNSAEQAAAWASPASERTSWWAKSPSRSLSAMSRSAVAASGTRSSASARLISASPSRVVSAYSSNRVSTAPCPASLRIAAIRSAASASTPGSASGGSTASRSSVSASAASSGA